MSTTIPEPAAEPIPPQTLPDAALLAQADHPPDEPVEEVPVVPPTAEQVATAAGIRAASALTPNAPEPPDTTAVDINAALLAQANSAPQAASDSKDQQTSASEDIAETATGLIEGLDARLHVALGLARRGLSFASINDLAKAVLLMLDVHTTPNPAKSPLANAAAKGEEPALL